MYRTLRGIVQEGRVVLLEQVEVPEGTEALVTLLPSGEAEPAGERGFWLSVSQGSLDEVWDRPEDDVYAKLLEE